MKQLIFLKKWDSTVDASNSCQVSKQNINHCLKGRSKTAGGFIWKYEDEYHDN